MKTLSTYLVVGLLTLSASFSRAGTASDVVASPVVALQQEKGELADLRAKLDGQKRLRSNGEIGIGLSAASTLVGFVVTVLGASVFVASEGSLKGIVPLGGVVLGGGAAASVGSIVYVVVKSSEISKLEAAIDDETKKIDTLENALGNR